MLLFKFSMTFIFSIGVGVGAYVDMNMNLSIKHVLSDDITTVKLDGVFERCVIIVLYLIHT